MIGYHLSLMTAIQNTETDFWRRGGGTAEEWELEKTDSERQRTNLSENAEAKTESEKSC